jgi:AcrR family transcriptional regulator
MTRAVMREMSGAITRQTGLSCDTIAIEHMHAMAVPKGSGYTPHGSGASSADARERILGTAYDLFCREGVQTVGVDRIVAEAGVAKATLYRHFRSKDALILAVLERREHLWTHGWLEHEIDQRGKTPEARLLAVFDIFDEWFHRDDYESCLFITTLLETHDPTSRVREDAVSRLANVRVLLHRLAEQIGVRDPDDFSWAIQQQMMGSIIAVSTGDTQAAKRARDVALLLLERETAAS